MIWSPESPGVEFKDIPGAPAPADTPAARLRQMKVLTDRFKVTMTGWKPDKSDREELRLLPKPLYRDEIGEGSGPDPAGSTVESSPLCKAQTPRPSCCWRRFATTGLALAICLCPGNGIRPGARLDKTLVWAVEFLEGKNDTAPAPDDSPLVARHNDFGLRWFQESVKSEKRKVQIIFFFFFFFFFFLKKKKKKKTGYDAGWEDRSRLAFGQCVTRVSLWEVVIMRNRTGWIFSLAGVVIFSGHARLRAQVVDKPQEDSKAIKAMVDDSVSWYQVFSDASAPEAMAPQRVLRRQNGTRGTQESDGVFVLWVHQGRPEASASIFPYEGSINYELVSLSRESKLVGAKMAA